MLRRALLKAPRRTYGTCPIRPGLYQHYLQGNQYEAIGLLINAETGTDWVLYRDHRPSSTTQIRNPRGLAYVRSLQEFTGKVQLPDGTWVPRFKPVPDS